MKKFILKNKLVLLITILFFNSVFITEGSSVCSPEGYTVISINGMLTSSSGAIENKERIRKSLFPSYNNQKIIYDYVYNPTHGFFADFIDAMTQKTSEKMFISDTHDLKDMLVDLSAKVKTQKLLIVAHSQGNFYANDIYRTLGDKQGGISKSSMGIYGIGTPTSYIAGDGKYILSKNDSIINKIRLFGMIDVLPANVDIPKDDEDELDGHGLSATYLKYQGKRISADVMTALHKLKEDPVQDPNQACINPPEITILDETVDLAYKILDPIQELIKDTTNLAINDIAKPVFGLVNKFGRGYMKLVNSLFSTANMSENTNENKDQDYTQEEAENILADQNSEEGTDIDYEDKTREEENLRPVFAQNYDDNLTKNINEDTKNESQEIKKIKSSSHHSSHQRDLNNEEGAEENSGEDNSSEDENDDSSNQEGNQNPNDEDDDADENNDDEDEEVINPPVNPGDTVSPVIFLIGDENIRISNGTTYTEYGATANDSVDGNIEVEIIGSVDTSENGIYTITYKATDKAGNYSTKERTIEVYTPLPGLYIDENTELPAGEYFFENVTVTNNATLTLLTDNESDTDGFRGVKINATNVTIDSGATISSDNKGFFIGPGTMTDNQSGGSHGGKGEWAEEEYVYGSAVYPKNLGSGGAIQNHYYKGGGAIWIEASGTVINNGVVSATGGGSASGGSVYVNTKNLEGTGTFMANGGGLTYTSIFYYPGGGGRTAVHYENSSFTGTVEAAAGSGHVGYPNIDKGEDGTAGLFDKKNKILYVNKSWEFLKVDESFEINEVIVSDNAQIRFQEGADIFVDTFILKDLSQIIFTGNENFETKELWLKDTSKVTTYPETILKIKTDNLYIEPNAIINAQSLGLSNGPGTPDVEDWGSTGASYGGKGGGENSKPTYGDENEPVDFGSGTEGFRGGGSIYIEVKDTLSNDGTITTDGYPWRASGGSIYIRTKILSGSGKIFSRGANGYVQGPESYGIAGGGGRIAIYYEENNFTGEANANGGDFCYSGCNHGAENGTVVLVDEDSSSENYMLSFSFAEVYPSVVGLINSENGTVYATVANDVDLSTLAPTISISPLATIDKASLSVQDFNSPVTYTITAENGQTKTYTVHVSKDLGVTIPVDDIDPLIISYALNATTEDIIVDPAIQDVVIEMTSNENVDWVSIEIEKVDETSIRKIYLSGELCEDGGNYCTKTWRGELSGTGTILKEGDYHVNVHIKDTSLNETYYVLPSLIKVKKTGSSEPVEIVI